MLTGPRLIVALDFDTQDECLNLVSNLDPTQCRLKVGKESFTRFGPELVRKLQAMGFDIFLDLKFHDIPNTVAKAVLAAADLGVWMVNVHACGGERMLRAARQALSQHPQPPILIAVTVLTSMEKSDFAALGMSQTIPQQVTMLGQLAQRCELDGVVCSAKEAALLKQQCGAHFISVTPGIRPANSEQADQRRVVTPAEAIGNGSDYLVVGRPITQAKQPLLACQQIVQEIDSAVKEGR
ncbi:MAG: orotidine-5'-phosphate decarboxylase [Cellvibrionaceae bacterium]|nr:orotidine-5'-phosphate decarboxylase [Cellvibrionaceae bacterium]